MAPFLREGAKGREPAKSNLTEVDITKDSRTNTIKAVTVFSLSILAVNTLLVLLFEIGVWEILWDYIYEDPMCNEVSYHCLYPWVVLFLLVCFASYSYGIIFGLAIIRGILRIKGNYLGTLASALIGAIPTLFLLVPLLFLYIVTLYPYSGVVVAIGFAAVVAVAAGIGYGRELQGAASAIGVLGIVSGAFFSIVGIALLVPVVHSAF